MARSKKARAASKAERKSEQPEAYDPWEDRPDRHRARPTWERRKRGDYRLVAGEDAGATYAIDEASTPLRRAYVAGAISRGQLYAGERFEALARASVPKGPRSCLDWMPRGTAETETEYQVRAFHAWKEICQHIGMMRSFRLISVCVHHEGTGPRRDDLLAWRHLWQGLDWARIFWGIPADEKQENEAGAK